MPVPGGRLNLAAMRRLPAVGLAIVLAASGASAQEQDDVSPLASLDFLLGRWEATSGGTPATPLGTTSFERKLGSQVVVRTCHTDVSATKDRGASVRDDLMVIYANSDRELRADYYDSDGRVLRYTIETTDDTAVFTSEPSPGQPRYRITYQLAYAGIVTGELESSPAAEPEGFKSRLTWTMKHPAPKSR